MAHFQNDYRHDFSHEVLILEAKANMDTETDEVMRLSPQLKDLLFAQYLSHATDGDGFPFFSATSTLIEKVNLMDPQALERFKKVEGFSETDLIILSAIYMQ